MAFVYGTRNNPPFAAIDFVFMKHQFDRSVNLRNVDMIVIGDSSGLAAIDPISLEKQFKAIKVQVLSSAVLVGPLGHILMAENYFKSNHHLDTLVLVWTPLAFSVQSLPWEPFILNGTGGPIRTIFKFGRAVLREKLFLGFLNSPFPGEWGRMYVSGDEYRNKIDEQHGTVIFPERKTRLDFTGPRKPYDYILSSIVESSIRKAGAKLKGLSVDKIFLAFTPMPNGKYDPKPEVSRKQFILKIQKLLRLPRESLLETPPTFPDELFSDPSHLNEKGRVAFTEILKNSLLNASCKSNIKTSDECSKLP